MPAARAFPLVPEDDESAPAVESPSSPSLSIVSPGVASAGSGEGDGIPGSLAALLTMLAHVPVPALLELERAARLHLHPPISARARRVARLGQLAEMLERYERGDLAAIDEPPDPKEGTSVEWSRIPRLPRYLYEQLRTDEAPSADSLVKSFGGWPQVRRAAYGLLPDGRYTGYGRPWPHRSRAGEPFRLHSEQTVTEAIRECGRYVGRRPTTTDYFHWQRTRKTKRGRRGAAPAPPDLKTIYRFFDTWACALGACAMTDNELADARAELRRQFTASDRHQGSPAARLDALTDGELTRIRLVRGRLPELCTGRFEQLELGHACTVADALEGSLDWLVGRSAEPGTSPAATGRFNGQRFRALRRDRSIPERVVLALLGWPLGALRRVVNERESLTLGDALTLAQLFDVEIADLVKPGPGAWRIPPDEAG